MKFSFCDSLHVLNSITSVFSYAYHEVNMHRIILLVISLHFWLQKSASLFAFQNTLCKSFSWKWPGLVLNFSMKKLFACYSTQTIGFKTSTVLSCSLSDINIQFHHLKDQMNKNHAKCSLQKTTLKENFVLLGVKILNFTQSVTMGLQNVCQEMQLGTTSVLLYYFSSSRKIRSHWDHGQKPYINTTADNIITRNISLNKRKQY